MTAGELRHAYGVTGGLTPARWEVADPPRWRRQVTTPDGARWRIPGGLTVIASLGVYAGERWLHMSASHPGRLPSWPEMVAIRDALAPGVECYQVAPPPDRYVNLHPRVLHLWGNLDLPSGVLPAFEGLLPDGRRTI